MRGDKSVYKSRLQWALRGNALIAFCIRWCRELSYSNSRSVSA